MFSELKAVMHNDMKNISENMNYRHNLKKSSQTVFILYFSKKILNFIWLKRWRFSFST